MLLEALRPEILQSLEPVVVALPFVLTALHFTKKQRDAILQRDGNKCRAEKDGIVCSSDLEVDHLIPKRFAQAVLGMSDTEINNPRNLLSKCVNHHRGHPASKHPDMHKAIYEYRAGDKTAIQNVFAEREKLCNSGTIYWNNKNDSRDRSLAAELTEQAEKKGWQFPAAKRRTNGKT